jgi:hypothetical protein
MKKKNSLLAGAMLVGVAAAGAAVALNLLRKKSEDADYDEFQEELDQTPAEEPVDEGQDVKYVPITQEEQEEASQEEPQEEPQEDEVTEEDFADPAPTTVELDTDGNGVVDTILRDTDGDGTVDTVELDTTGDGQVDTILRDTDGDGMVDTVEMDTNGDGVMDTVLGDTDGDGTLDHVAPLEPSPEEADEE